MTNSIIYPTKQQFDFEIDYKEVENYELYISIESQLSELTSHQKSQVFSFYSISPFDFGMNTSIEISNFIDNITFISYYDLISYEDNIKDYTTKLKQLSNLIELVKSC